MSDNNRHENKPEELLKKQEARDMTEEELEQVTGGLAIANPMQALQGQTPGVQITSTGGQPGAGSTIKVRGASSITGSSGPLFIVD